MLVAQSIPVLLGQALGEGVEGAYLMQQDGSVLGSCTTLPGDQTQHSLAAAIEACSLWANYSAVTAQTATPDGNEQTLNCCIVECEGRKLCLLEVSKLLLCLVSTAATNVGMLRKKATLLAQQFREPFEQIFGQLHSTEAETIGE